MEIAFRQGETTVSFQQVKEYFASYGLSDRVMEFSESSATVELAAAAVGCEPARIAKTLSFYVNGQPVLVVTAGDAKIDNKKFKAQFQEKAKMIPFDEVEAAAGNPPGGVCPFAVRPDIPVYLDVSMKRFDTVFPAAGSANSAVRITPEELELHSRAKAWVDVCKGWSETSPPESDLH